MNPEIQRRKDATKAITDAKTLDAKTVLAVMREQIVTVTGDGPYANAYRTAIFDVMIALAARLQPDGEMVSVNSSNVDSIGYNPVTRILRVRYKSGDTYRYEDVNGDQYAAILSSQSVGRAVSKLRHLKTTKEER